MDLAVTVINVAVFGVDLTVVFVNDDVVAVFCY